MLSSYVAHIQYSLPLVIGPVKSCTISTAVFEHTALQPFRRLEIIAYIAISVLPGTHLHLSQAWEGKVPCPRTQHLNNVPVLRGEKHDISRKILYQAGFETARQAATLAKRNNCATSFSLYDFRVSVCQSSILLVQKLISRGISGNKTCVTEWNCDSSKAVLKLWIQ